MMVRTEGCHWHLDLDRVVAEWVLDQYDENYYGKASETFPLATA